MKKTFTGQDDDRTYPFTTQEYATLTEEDKRKIAHNRKLSSQFTSFLKEFNENPASPSDFAFPLTLKKEDLLQNSPLVKDLFFSDKPKKELIEKLDDYYIVHHSDISLKNFDKSVENKKLSNLSLIYDGSNLEKAYFLQKSLFSDNSRNVFMTSGKNSYETSLISSITLIEKKRVPQVEQEFVMNLNRIPPELVLDDKKSVLFFDVPNHHADFLEHLKSQKDNIDKTGQCLPTKNPVNKYYLYAEHEVSDPSIVEESTEDVEISTIKYQVSLFNGVAVLGDKQEIQDLNRYVDRYPYSSEEDRKFAQNRKILKADSLEDQFTMIKQAESPVILVNREDKEQTLDNVLTLKEKPQLFTHKTEYVEVFTANSDSPRKTKASDLKENSVVTRVDLTSDGELRRQDIYQIYNKNSITHFSNSQVNEWGKRSTLGMKDSDDDLALKGDRCYMTLPKTNPFISDALVKGACPLVNKNDYSFNQELFLKLSDTQTSQKDFIPVLAEVEEETQTIGPHKPYIID